MNEKQLLSNHSALTFTTRPEEIRRKRKKLTRIRHTLVECPRRKKKEKEKEDKREEKDEKSNLNIENVVRGF